MVQAEDLTICRIKSMRFHRQSHLGKLSVNGLDDDSLGLEDLVISEQRRGGPLAISSRPVILPYDPQITKDVPVSTRHTADRTTEPMRACTHVLSYLFSSS